MAETSARGADCNECKEMIKWRRSWCGSSQRDQAARTQRDIAPEVSARMCLLCIQWPTKAFSASSLTRL